MHRSVLLLLTWALSLMRIAGGDSEALNVSCRYYGVFHVEQHGRYALSRDEGKYACESFGTLLATLPQLEKAYTAGFQTCRYGWVQGHVAIVRQEPHYNCAANGRGVIVLNSTIFSEKYDVYCFNESDTQEKVCDPLRKLLRLPTIIPTEFSVTSPDDSDVSVSYNTTSPEKTVSHDEVDDDIYTTPTTTLSHSDENSTSYGTPPLFIPPGDWDIDSKNQSTSTVSSLTGDEGGHPFSSTLHSEVLDDQSSNPTPSVSGGDVAEEPLVTTPAIENGTFEDSSKKADKTGRRFGPEKINNVTLQGQGTSTDASQTDSAKHSDHKKLLPDWLIILIALLAVLVIVTFCIIIANRKRLCGKQKKLVITDTKEKPKKEPKKEKKQEVNGDTKRSEETVQLMNADAMENQSKPADESVAINVSDADEPSTEDMKSSV